MAHSQGRLSQPQPPYSSIHAENKLRLLKYAIAYRAVVLLVLVLSTTFLEPFDDSHRLHDRESIMVKLMMRWDAFHFTQVAMKGYIWEHQWAWMPLFPFLIRVGGMLLGGGLNGVLWSGTIINIGLGLWNTVLFYDLSVACTHLPTFSLLAGTLFVLQSSPVVSTWAGYTEVIFTMFSLLGFSDVQKERWGMASIWFAFAGGVRSNGVLLVGFVGWGRVFWPLMQGRKVSFLDLLCSTSYISVILFPFALFNYYGWSNFCQASSSRPQWCEGWDPLIYRHVQDQYWNVGLFRYWTIAQIPNFLLATPILTMVYYSAGLFLLKLMAKKEPLPVSSALLPHALYALGLTTYIFVGAHVQILLRLAMVMPWLYWGTAWVITQNEWIGKVWVGWWCVYTVVGSVLWATFLPPA